MSETNALLEIRNLSTSFRTKDGTVKAVNGVSYGVGEGDILGIVGESGSGKSVSMLSVMRLIPNPPGEISADEVFFYGRNLLDLSESQMQQIRGTEIAMIFQDPMTSLNPVLTVGRQITEALEVNLGMNRGQSRRRAAELLDIVGIPNAAARLGDYPHQFSGGMRQRVMIAMALSCNPLLLIADEPTTALDVTIQAQIIDLVKRLQEQLGMAVIWISHDLGVVARIAQRVLVMYAGFVVEDAPVYELFANPRHPYTIGLLGSLPRLDLDGDAELISIPGQPPDMTHQIVGCPFAPRCTFATARCQDENPDLAAVGGNHRAACWEATRTAGVWQTTLTQRSG